jgi:hypothetical protein
MMIYLIYPSSGAADYVLPSSHPPPVGVPAMVLSPSLEPMVLSTDVASFPNSAEDTMYVEPSPVASDMAQDRDQHIGQDLSVDSNFAGTLVPSLYSDEQMTSENDVENSLALGFASVPEAGPSISSAAGMTFINSGLHDMGSMSSALGQAEVQSMGHSVTITAGPRKIGRPRTKPLPDPSLPKWPAGRPSTKSAQSLSMPKRSAGRPPSKIPAFGSSNSSNHPLPPLRDPAAPRGPTYTSVTQWLHNTPDGAQVVQPISENTLPDQLPSEATIKSPPVRVIVAEPDETAAIMDTDNVDEIGAEDLEDTEINNDSEPTGSCKDFPEWFSHLLDEKLKLLNKQKDGKFVFYGETQNFWLPHKANWFNMWQTKALGPEAAYNPRFFFWDPLQLVKIKCPNFVNCQTWLARNTIWKRPRRCVDLQSCFWIIGACYKMLSML